MSVTVRIVQLGKRVFNYVADDGSTVGEGLAAAGIPVEHMEIRVRGVATTLDQALADGDLVTVIPKIKGGSPVRD
jgi:molybdopterin converting factor small subunit